MKLRLFGCLTLSLLSTVVACGGDDGGSPPPVDARVTGDGATIDTPAVVPDAASVDAAPSVVMEVPCPATPASEVSAPGFSFVITTASVPVNSIVRFTMPGSHSAVSGETAGVDDGQFRVNFQETKCLRFTAAGTYGFWCNPHQFVGSITVTP